jgi:O-antigen/teichoic acid export membrane protein
MKKKKSVKANAFFNTFREFLDLAAPMITFPYVARVLMPENLGKVQFAASIVQLFAFFAALGLPLYGVRKIAQVRDDLHERSKVFKSLLTIELITTAIVYVVFAFSIFYVEKFNREIVLFLILGIKIGFKTFGFEWFFKGMEEYKFMAYRRLIAKIIGIVLTFVIVRGPEDYILYGSISIITMFFSRIMNYWNLRKMIEHVPFKEVNLKDHINGAVYFFFLFMSTKLYNNIDKVMLGFLSGDTSVSYYVTANKLIRIIKTIFVAANSVLIPRFSNLVAKGNHNKVKSLSKKAVSNIFFLSLPAMAGLYLLSHEVIMLFGGQKYLPSVMTMRILLPILILIPMKSFIGKQILLTYGKQRLVILAIFTSTLLNIALNAFLIPLYGQNGAAFASIVSEIMILMIEVIFGWSYIKRMELKLFRNYKYGAATLIMVAGVYYLKSLLLPLSLSSVSLSLIAAPAGALLYVLALVILRESLFLPMISKMILKRLPGKKRS